MSGSASKVIRVTKVSVVGTATAASIYDHYIVKRTTANTGGTSTTKTAAQSDSNDAAQTATLSLYTANPTTGTGVTVEGNKTYLSASATPGAAALPYVYTFGTRNDKAIVLRGTAESLAINFGGQAVPSGANLYLSIEWTEDDV